MTASGIPVSATTVPSLSQRARNLIHQHGDTSYRCGEWDGDEAGDYNTVHGEASDAEADLVAYVAELERPTKTDSMLKATHGLLRVWGDVPIELPTELEIALGALEDAFLAAPGGEWSCDMDAAPRDTVLDFWLEWALDMLESRPLSATQWKADQRFRGFKGQWSSVYRATHWRPLPAPPAASVTAA